MARNLANRHSFVNRLKQYFRLQHLPMGIGIVSLIVASISLFISIGADLRSSEQFISSMAAILDAKFDKDSGLLTMETTEKAKSLIFGDCMLPNDFHHESMVFKAPENTIDFGPVAKRISVVFERELELIKKEYPLVESIIPERQEFAVPLFCETRTTIGGSSIDTWAAYVLVVECPTETPLMSQKQPIEIDRKCNYKALVHNGRMEIGTPGFFHSPWATAKQIAEKGRKLKRKRIRKVLNESWENERPSVKWPSQDNWPFR